MIWKQDSDPVTHTHVNRSNGCIFPLGTTWPLNLWSSSDIVLPTQLYEVWGRRIWLLESFCLQLHNFTLPRISENPNIRSLLGPLHGHCYRTLVGEWGIISLYKSHADTSLPPKSVVSSPHIAVLRTYFTKCTWWIFATFHEIPTSSTSESQQRFFFF